MKILYYSTAYYATHGGSTHSRHFVSAARKHPEVTSIDVFPGKASGGAGTGNNSGGLRSMLRSSSLLQIFFFYRRNTFYLQQLFRKIGTFRPDVLLVRIDSNFLQLQKVRDRFPELIISTEINASPFEESFRNIAFRKVFQRIERKHLTRCDLNFFVSRALRDSIMVDVMNPERDKVVQNGVDITVFKPLDNRNILRQKFGYADTHTLAGYLGTLDYHKAVDKLLQAMLILKQKHSSLRLIIVGDGPSKGELQKLSEDLALKDVVLFAGACAHSEVPQYLNTFDIAIHHKAGDYMSPIKLFEYLACELPVIAPDTPAVREVFENGEDVLLTNGEPGDIAEKVAHLLRDKELRARLASSGKAKVVRGYTWQANADRIILEFFKKLRR